MTNAHGELNEHVAYDRKPYPTSIPQDPNCTGGFSIFEENCNWH